MSQLSFLILNGYHVITFCKIDPLSDYYLCVLSSLHTFNVPKDNSLLHVILSVGLLGISSVVKPVELVNLTLRALIGFIVVHPANHFYVVAALLFTFANIAPPIYFLLDIFFL